MKYFGHDCNAGDDPRLIKVKLKYNIMGYGVYFRCLEFIGAKMSEQCRDGILEPDLEILQHDFNIPQKKILEVLEYFVELGLFEKTKDGKYKNSKLWSRKDEYTEKRVRKMEKSNYDSIPNVSGHGRYKVPLKESKRKESKVNESKSVFQKNFKILKQPEIKNMREKEVTPL